VSDTAAIITTAVPTRAAALVTRFMGTRGRLESPLASAEIVGDAPANSAPASREIGA
jgi:hypothetical protein